MEQAAQARTWPMILRRALFIFALLSHAAISTSSFDYVYNNPAVRVTGGKAPLSLIAFAAFMLGAGSISIVLAVWLVSRTGVWRTWSGRLRAAVYLLAYSYGRMLHSATQDWLHQRGPDGLRISDGAGAIPFRWPGLYFDDYARPLLDLHILLIYVWLFIPAFVFCRGALSEKQLNSERNASFSVIALISWITTASIILLWTRVLTWAPLPETAYSHMSPMEAYGMLLWYVPGKIIIVVAVMITVIAWSGVFWQALVAFFVVLLVDGFGQWLYYGWIDSFRFEFLKSNVLEGPALERWSNIVGRNSTVWIAFGLASLTGVSFRRMTHTSG